MQAEASEALDVFMNVARNNDDFEFLVTSDSELFTEFAVTRDSVVIFKQVVNASGTVIYLINQL